MRRFFTCNLLCTSIVIRAWAQAAAPTPAPPAGGAAPAATTSACDGKIQLVGRVVEGTKVVNGVAETPGDTVRILDTTNATADLLPMTGGSFSVSSDSTTGVFNAALADPLYQGQKIQIQEYNKMNAPAMGCLDFTVPGIANWGRVRADVAAGVVLSQDNQFTAATASGSTTQSTLFLDFQVEKNWKWLGLWPTSSVAPRDTALPPAVVGQIYSVQMDADLPGAVLPLHYSISTLSWLKITDSGLLYSPNPAALASSGAKVEITVTDGSNPPQTRSREFLIRVVQWPVVRLVASQSSTLPPATVGSMYHLQLEEDLPVGAQPPLTYSLSGNPPTWLSVDQTGLLTGNPMMSDVTASVSFTITVNDAASPQHTYPFPVTIAVSTQPPFTPPPAFPIHFEGSPRGKKKIGELESRWGFSSYFETRLTSVPVATCQTATTTPATGAGGGTSNANSCPAGTNTTTFLNSQKSAELIGGAYFPIVVQTWKWNNAPNALFFAPIAKIGFIAPTGSTSTTTQTATTTGATATTTIQPVVPSQFYNFYTFGGRIGHLRLSNDRNSAPESLSYIDVGMGRFSNLDTLVPVYYDGTPLPSPSGGLLTAPIRRWRVAVEGLLKIPDTPFSLGMSANVGQNLFAPGNNIPAGAAHTVQAAKDDLRFFVGMKFDLGNLLSKLQTF